MMKSNGIIIHDTDIGEYWKSLFLESGLDTLGIHPAGGVDAHLSLDDFLKSLEKPEVQRFIYDLKGKGFNIQLECHALSWLLPRDLYQKHPHWFRENEKGERTADFNMCPSCVEALKYLEEHAAFLASLIPWNGENYHLWIDDVAAAPCRCDACHHLSSSDQAMIIYNSILKGLKTYNANARLAYLAYHGTMEPPTVTPEKGIFLEFAPFKRRFDKCIFDPKCAENAAELKYLDELLSFFGKENSKVLEYWMDNSLFSGWKKPYKELKLNTEILRKDVSFYRSKGFEHITSFGCFLGEEYAMQYGIPPVKEYSRIINLY